MKTVAITVSVLLGWVNVKNCSWAISLGLCKWKGKGADEKKPMSVHNRHYIYLSIYIVKNALNSLVSKIVCLHEWELDYF